MAKVKLNSALRQISGTMDNWVYRRNGDDVSISKRPTVTKAPTAAQLAVREKFRGAVGYARTAMLDPALRSRYEAAARVRGMRVLPFVVTDYFTPPVVDLIDTSGYHGRVGDVIIVNAFDDFEVARVTVVIRDGADEIVVQGAAVPVNGRWNYAITAGIQVGETVTVEAVATDRTGQTGSRRVALVIA